MMTEMTFAEAALLALKQEMERDHRVWALGEDLGPEGGLAGQYKGLQTIFGKDRILDTPISENMIMAAGVGAALAGTRPVVELRFADFGMCAADELVNQAAKNRYMFNGQSRVPLVVRMAIGMRGGTAAQHSQSTEAWWVHIPGLVVVTPSTPANMHGLLKAAIRCDDPVVYLEHKAFWGMKGPVDTDAGPMELGKAEIVRGGRDVTMVTWAGTRLDCAKATELLSEKGVSAELIDLRTLWPWDRETVMASVAKTGRLLIAQEAVRVGGFGGEVAAEIGELMFAKLKAPIRRLGAPRTPVPYSVPMEDFCRVTPAQIAAAALDMMSARKS